jgi:uncharacterized damage-inducible protein DinB
MKITLATLILSTGILCAQNPLSTSTKGLFDGVKNNIVKAAEKMPEENYGFKPVDGVRSFGQLVGHLADANNMFCSAVKGEKNPSPGIEKGKTSKADLVAALKAAVAYCDGVYAGMTDADAAGAKKMFGRDFTNLSLLNLNTSHSNEHYGNMVTYMRIKGLVPPSSEGR